jgi:hypothetical protein
MKIKFLLCVSCFLKGALLLIFTFLLINCSDKSQKHNTYKINVDTVKIEISSKFIDYYITYNILDEQNLFVGYNYIDHSLQFIDLKNRETKHTIDLEKDGPNKINIVGDIFITDDKIFLQSTPDWIIINHTGQILKRINFIDLAEKLDNKYLIDGGFSLNYMEKKEISPDYQSIFIRLYPTNAKMNSREFYENPLFCKLYFYEKIVEIKPYLPYPEIFKTGYKYGMLDKPSVVELDDRLIYSFPNHSNIYIYNFQDSSISSNEVKSSKINSVIEVNQKGSLRDVLKSSLLGDRYHPVAYDKFKDVYYRVIRVKNEVQDINEYFLQIIDHKFNLIEEINLPTNKIYKNRYVVTKNGLYFQLMSSKSNIFSYILVDVQLEK